MFIDAGNIPWLVFDEWYLQQSKIKTDLALVLI